MFEAREGETRVEPQSDRVGGFAGAKGILGFDGVSPSRLWTQRVRRCAREKLVVMRIDFAIVTAQVNRYFDLFFGVKKAVKMGLEPMFNGRRRGTVFCLTDSKEGVD